MKDYFAITICILHFFFDEKVKNFIFQLGLNQKKLFFLHYI